MTTTKNDQTYRQIMKAVKARREMMEWATTEAERTADAKAIQNLLDQAKVLTSRI